LALIIAYILESSIYSIQT